MKAVILAGGRGTRITEESQFKPKPMIEIGDRPILWHILKTLYHQGINEFIICAGYKQHIIKEYFANYHLHCCDITFDFSGSGDKEIFRMNQQEKWRITVADTGLDTMTGGRIKRVRDYVDDEPFLMTYGDGVSNIDISKLVQFHKSHNKLATLTAVHPPGRFGVLDFEDDLVKRFGEKTEQKTDWINGGYMVLDPKIMDFISGDDCIFEQDVLPKISSMGQLTAYKHPGFWQCMDNMRDKSVLEDLWGSNNAPWKNWERYVN